MNIQHIFEKVEPIRIIVRNLRKDGPNRTRTEEKAAEKTKTLNACWQELVSAVKQFKPVANAIELSELDCLINEAESLKREAENRIKSSIVSSKPVSPRVVSSGVNSFPEQVKSDRSVNELQGEQKEKNSVKSDTYIEGREPIDFNTSGTEESTTKMASFDFNTAQKLPNFSASSEEKRDEELRDFLSSVEFYHDTLKADQQPIFVKFLLKCKIQGKALTELGNETPTTFSELEKILKGKCGSRDTINSIQSKLYSLKQGRKSIKEFTCELESLIIKLTDLEVKEQGETARSILQKSNETRGFFFLKNNVNDKYKIILECSRHKNLREAIEHLLEVESSQETGNTVYSLRQYGNRNNFVSRNQVNGELHSRNNYPRRNNFQMAIGNQNRRSFFGYQNRQNFQINRSGQNSHNNAGRQRENLQQNNNKRENNGHSNARAYQGQQNRRQGRDTQYPHPRRVFTLAEEENLEHLEGVTVESRDSN